MAPESVMERTVAEIPYEQLAEQLKLSPVQIQNVVALLDEGWSVPFLAQYRLDHTDGASERVLSRLARMLAEIRYAHQRKASLIEYLKSRGELTEQLKTEIDTAVLREKVEHLHSIYKRNRQPKALVERSDAVDALAQRILSDDVTTADVEKELARIAAASELFTNARDVSSALHEAIVAHFSKSLPLRELALDIIRDTGSFRCRRYQAGDDGSLSEPLRNEATDSETAAMDSVTGESVTDENRDSTEGETAPAESTATVASPETATRPVADEDSAAAAQSDMPGDETESPPSEATSESATAATDASSASEPDAANSTDAAKSTGDQADSASPSNVTILNKVHPTKSLADQRRQRRKESRLRRRAHLESMLKDYFGAAFPLEKLTASQFADIDYGERVRVLTAQLEFDRKRFDKETRALLLPKSEQHVELIEKGWQQAIDSFVIPDCERIVRRYYSWLVEQQGIAAIKRRVRNICMQRPLYQPLMAINGTRDGFSLAIINAVGETLHSEELARNDFGPDKLRDRITELCDQHSVQVIGIADSPRTRLIEQLAAESLGTALREKNIRWFSVATEGLDNFCKSATACEEIPNVTPEQRSAIALARRAQDPLLEFVKASPRDWLSEMQQTTVDVKRLDEEIRHVYHSCLARVGVDINRASAAVLSQLAGLDLKTAHQIVLNRQTAGPISDLRQLGSSLELSERMIDELSGFLRVYRGENPFDALGIHPSHYEAATKTLRRCDLSMDDLKALIEQHCLTTADTKGQSTAESTVPPGADSKASSPDERRWAQALRGLNVGEVAGQVGLGKEQLRRVVNELSFAGRDIRMKNNLPVLRDHAISLSTLKPGDLVSGRVVNVAPFGAFVEIAPGLTGLIHISRLGDRYVKDPRELITAGELLAVWIVSVDQGKQRIALAFNPPSPRKPTSTTRRPRGGGRPSRGDDRRPRKTEYKPKPKRKPKPVVPITDEMKTGAAPMRTFGDLKQFFELAKEDTPPKDTKAKGQRSAANKEQASSSGQPDNDAPSAGPEPKEEPSSNASSDGDTPTA